MKKLYELSKFNFGALAVQNFAVSKIVVLPIPYEATVSGGTGTKNGPRAIIQNSRNLDEMTPDRNGNLEGFASADVYTVDEIILSKTSPEDAVAGVSQAVSDFAVSAGKFPLVLGGEHSITPGVTAALKAKFGNFGVLQIDAHTDLMNEYEGTRFSHACAMRRVLDQKLALTQVGIRNFNPEVRSALKNSKVKTFFGKNVPVAKILDTLPKNVYVTIDLDGFDPSIMPSTGTPEPGGLLWEQGIELLDNVFRKTNVIGADIVELAPIPGIIAPDFLAAKLAYEIIRMKLTRNF